MTGPDPDVLAAALQGVADLWAQLFGPDCPLEGVMLEGKGPRGEEIAYRINLAAQAVVLARGLVRLRQGREANGGAPTRQPRQDESRHSPDFRSVYDGGQTYSLTKAQAQVVRVLWEARENHCPDVGDEVLLRASGTEQVKLALVFRDSPAWGALVREGLTRGTHRLGQPGPQADAPGGGPGEGQE